MSKVVQSEELGRGLFAVICRLLLSGVPGVCLMRGWTRRTMVDNRQRVVGAVAGRRLLAVAGEGRVHDAA